MSTSPTSRTENKQLTTGSRLLLLGGILFVIGLVIVLLVPNGTPEGIGIVFMSIAVMREFLVAQMELAQRRGLLREFDAGPVAEIFVRAAISILLTPQSIIPLESEQDLREAARKYFVPVLQLAL